MDLPIPLDEFTGRGLMLRTAALLRGPRLVIDGSEVKGSRLKFLLRDNGGRQREIRLKSNGFDPVPKVIFGNQTIELMRPLAWYEYAWMSIPVLLVINGGVLGALFGLMGVHASARVFRSSHGLIAKYVLSALVSLGVAIAFLIFATVATILIGLVSKR